MIIISLIIRICFIFYNYKYGFLLKDFSLINIDGYSYAYRGATNYYNQNMFFSPGIHWLYPYINLFIGKYLIKPSYVYIFISFLNTFIYTLIPIISIPIVKIFDFNTRDRYKYLTIFSGLVLFWPAGIWLSTQNLKDTLIAFLFISYISLIIKLCEEKLKIKWIIFITMITILYLISALRIYFAFFIFIATCLFCIKLMNLKKKKFKIFIIFLLLTVIFLISPYFDYVVNFLKYENNFLINPAVAERINYSIINKNTGEAEFTVNYNIIGFLRDFIITIWGPFPKLLYNNIYELILVLQSCFIYLSLFFFIFFYIKWKSKYKIFFTIIFIATIFLFSMSHRIGGPRKTFSSIDLIYIIFLSGFLVKYYSKKIINLSFLIGLLNINVFLFYTSFRLLL